jgi:hypothetical protein
MRDEPITDSAPTLDDLIQHQQQLLENYQPNPVVTKIARGILDALERLREIEVKQSPGEIAEFKKLYTPAMIQKIAQDDMPECFDVTRPAFVAMAQLLMDALNTIESFISERGVKH